MKLQITVEGKTYEVEVEVLEDDAEASASAHGAYPPPAAAFESSPGQQSTGDGAWDIEDGVKVCRCPMTGLVVRVEAEPGQRVDAGALIMVIEAMKMETNIVAPGAAKVKRVHVAAGESVRANQVLAEFE